MRLSTIIPNIYKFFMYYPLMAFVLLLTLYILYRIKRIFNIEYLALFGSALILCLGQEGFRFYESKQLWLFCLSIAGFHFLLKLNTAQKYAPVVLKKFISSKRLVFTFSISFLLLRFLQYFPIKEWRSYILVDDYPVVFAFSKRGFDILRQGGYFGWASSFVGGYFTASEMGDNLAHFLFPLSFLGWEIGFHLMLLLFFIGFPFLCFYYVRVCCKVESNKALVAFLVASFFAPDYFSNLLRWGMVSTFIGVDLVILSLIFFQRLKEKGRYSFFILILTLSLLFYTHLGMFVYSIMFILLDFFISPNKKHLKYICYLGCFLLITSLPFLIYKIKYADYFILDNKNFFPAIFSLKAYLLHIARSIDRLFDFSLWHYTNMQYYPLFFSPVLLYMFFKKIWKKQVIFALFIGLFFIMIPPNLSLLLNRVVYLIPFFLSVLLAGFLTANWDKQYFIILLLGLFLSLLLFCHAFTMKPSFKHGKPGNFYNKPLVEKIKTLDGRYIAVENNQHWNHWGAGIIPSFHWLPLLQLETHKLFFSNMKDGYHHTPYRANSFEGGFFRGKLIDEWVIDDVNKIVSTWGIKYLVVWNKKTKEYFTNYHHFYEKIWQDKDWVIFRFLNSDTRDAVVDNAGEARIVDNDFYEKNVILSNCKKDSRVVLRSNYFPAWKAYYNNKEIPLINFNGQIGFIAPASGDYIIKLKFPRCIFLNILAIIPLILSGFLSYRKILP